MKLRASYNPSTNLPMRAGCWKEHVISVQLGPVIKEARRSKPPIIDWGFFFFFFFTIVLCFILLSGA